MDVKYAYYNTSKGYKVTGGTAAQFLKADGSLDNNSYVNKSGDTMSGTLTLNQAVSSTIRKDLSTITTGTGFARDILQLAGSNGVVDTVGWFGNVDAEGTVKVTYGYLGTTAYNTTKALLWTSDQRVGIGLGGASLPIDGYRLHVSGNSYTSGNIGVAGAINSTAGELQVQRQGVNRIRTNSTITLISGEGTSGTIYLRPQGDLTSTGQVTINANNTQFTDGYNLLFGNQLAAGSSVFHTNLPNSTHGYGMWLAHNLQFDGTDFIQPRGSLNSLGLSVNNHKTFSFNYASASGTNGSVPTLTEVVKISNTGKITTLNDGTSSDWMSAYNTGLLYRGVLGPTVDLNSITSTGWWVQTGNANATSANNYPAGLAGQLRVYYTSTHIVQEYTTYANNNDVYRRYYFSGTWYPWTKDWDSNDFSAANINNWNTAFNWGNHANAGYLSNAVLSNYYTKNESLNTFVGKSGVETISDTKTFTHSPVIPAGTLETHAVNIKQLNTKANGQENALAVGFSSGNIPTSDGNAFPYMYHSSGSYVALATQSYVQTNFLSTPNGTSVIISGTNLNNYLKTGFYRGVGLTNAPLNNNGWWYVVIETHDGTWIKQTATSFGSSNTSNITYQRTMSGGSWSDWAQIWTTQDFSTGNIQQWNYMAQYGLQLNSDFTVNTGSGLAISDNYLNSAESGIVDIHQKRLLATKRKEYYSYGSEYNGFGGLNFHTELSHFGMGREANGGDKLTVEGSVKASENFKSEDENPDTMFIPNGRTASLKDEIVNDQSDPKDYAVRLDPHEYEFSSSNLSIDDRNRLIHIIGEQAKMVVNFKEIYPKQQIVIYNFDNGGGTMGVDVYGKRIYNISPGCFLRLYVTNSRRVIAEQEQNCKFIW
ncbi:pyocin knob domain-containing protein [Chryseobacterium indologenes]|uniref:pyocin knob domain-containing protein n=1 Tax=Chryseobacterium indologenes TaxID=253 RepID=UPI001BD18912|nr:pyocin knob domain-containing protein [Chryseobacterium indologenes]